MSARRPAARMFFTQNSELFLLCPLACRRLGSPSPGEQLSTDTVDKRRREIEVRLTKPRERDLKVEPILLVGLSQHAQGTGNEEMPALGLGAPFPLVDQQAVGINRERA